MLTRLLSALAVILMTFTMTTNVYAQEEGTPAIDPTVVVLDASGSMTEMDVDGRLRMDVAKQAVNDFIGQVPDGSPLGLVTYGTGTGSTDEEKEAGCQDISVLAKPGEKNAVELGELVNGLEPRGYTPIGNALRQANELLPKEGGRSIVLVSDGIDTCAPPPVCEVAKELKDQGTDLVVHTVGFMVDEQARSELECIANVTGGSYADATDAASLTSSLSQATLRTAVGYQFPQDTVTFSTDKESAPMIAVGGLDNPTRLHATVPTGADTYGYAKVEIPVGYRLHIGYLAVPSLGTKRVDEEYSNKFSLYFSVNDCSGNGSSASTVLGGKPAAGYYITDIAEEANCSEPNHTFIQSHTINDNTPADADLMLALVPEAESIGDPFNETPPPDRNGIELEPQFGEATPITPSSFPDFSTPARAGTFEAEIVEGETQFIPVPVEWGQALDISVRVLENTDTSQDGDMTAAGRKLDIEIINPLLQAVADSGTNTIGTSGNYDPIAFSSFVPVSYGNISEIGEDSTWLAGTYFVQVTADSYQREEDTDATTLLKPIRYQIDLRPVGDAVDGPTFTTAQPLSTETASADAAATENSPRWPAIALVSLAVVCVLVAAVFVWWLLRRRT